ncbi:MAG TPA: HAMP domain-containing sensor histidine kinase [Gaiellaceae bacterium]|nr:HAMP domain-containing sensor histidine kinase [Gaiellaceae bacterium]
MFQSLRFRLSAIFLAAVVLAGLVSSLIAIRLFQDYTQSQTLKELRRESVGITQFYAEQAGVNTFSAKNLEKATGDKLFYIPVYGLNILPGAKLDLRPVPAGAVDTDKVLAGKVRNFEFTPPGQKTRYVAVARPLKLGEQTFGAMVVAKPKAALHEGLYTVLIRLSIAFAVGVALAAALAFYLSRRITEPVLALTRAADRVAGGRYDVDLSGVRGGGEIGQLTKSFSQMAHRLDEAERMERNFLMTVSHELRTPLTAIRGHVSALSEGVIDDRELARQSLEVIADAASRLERLVGDVLDLAKLDAHRFTLLEEEVEMERLCEQAYSSFAEEARRRGIAYRQEIGARPTLQTDGDRVLQIITNLLSNAFRWTPDGGRIELELAAENGSVSVAVRDTGPGIDAADRERIFRPFWSRDGSGTGLGLAIANELASALGGRIELESSNGLGSSFTLVLPGEHA